MQRRDAALRGMIHRGAIGEQQSDQLRMTARAAGHQWRHATVVRRVDGCAQREEESGGCEVSAYRRDTERR